MGYSHSFVTMTVEGGIAVPNYLGAASNPFLLTARSKLIQLVGKDCVCIIIIQRQISHDLLIQKKSMNKRLRTTIMSRGDINYILPHKTNSMPFI